MITQQPGTGGFSIQDSIEIPRGTSERVTFLSQAPEAEEIASRFPDYHPPLNSAAALAEANRCLYCFDAPCTRACPTHIDVPRFIKKIATGNLDGSARTILDANILGASCARACPVQVLCEGACVYYHYNEQPIKIGLLQRHAMDWLHASGGSLPFAPGPETGRHVALIGAGPASLGCAAELRRRGIRATIFDARALPGGLNTFGVAEYKLPLKESLREIDMLTQLGVEFQFNTLVDASMIRELRGSYDAIFLGIGLGAIHKLGIVGEEGKGVTNALDWIADYKSGRLVRSPARVCVIGAGNTAIDAAIAAVRLGAQQVTMVYRRGPEQISAFPFEYEHARAEGVSFLWHVQPVRVEHDAQSGELVSLELEPLEVAADPALTPAAGGMFSLAVDCVVLAIGQATHSGFVEQDAVTGSTLEMERGRILIDRETGQTSIANFFAGGDCTNGGREVVDAVADGKRAGAGIAAWLGVAHG